MKTVYRVLSTLAFVGLGAEAIGGNLTGVAALATVAVVFIMLEIHG
jgi:hypothetical protein